MPHIYRFERNGFMKDVHAKMTFRLILISFLALMLIGCGESGSPGGDSGPGVTASINLTAADVSLPADGLTSTTITAALADSGNEPVYEMTSVVFQTTRGTFRNGAKEYKVETADESGTVTVTLIADGVPGTAEVTAKSNNITQKTEVKFFDPTKVGTITLRTGSESITADGESRVAIVATVTDALGNPEEGASVKFKTSLGRFPESNPLPGIINRTETVVTDVDGEATVMLISGKTIGTATILASVDGLNAETTVTLTADVPHEISLRAAPSTVKPGGSTNLYAALTDVNGNPVANASVVFSQTVNASEGTIDTQSALTDVNGIAQITYAAGEEPGTDMIQAAWAGDLGMNTETTIAVDPDAVVINSITVSSGSPTLVADGKSQVKIRALVTDIDGTPAIGKIVHFTKTAGTLSDDEIITDSEGRAEIMLQSSTIAGPVTVRAACDGFIGEAALEFVPGPAHHIILYAFPDTVPPGGAFETAAIVQDKYDNRIEDQRLMLQVRLKGQSQIVDSAELTPDQAEDGVFRFDWTAARAYGQGNLEITARVNNGVSKAVTVVVDEDATIVGEITVTAGAEEIKADGAATVLIRATVLDYNGAPAQGIKVNFASTLGTPKNIQKETDVNGIADFTLKSGNTWGTATVTANANGFWGEVDVRFTSLAAGGVSLTAMPDKVAPGGQATLIAELRDTEDAPVPDEILYFDIYENNTNATLDNVSGTTDTNGRAIVTYTAGVITDNLCTACDCSGDRVRVTVASNSQFKDKTCIEVAEPTETTGYITLSAADESLPADGSSSTAITAGVFDTAGFPMPVGTQIRFSTTMGTFPGGVPGSGNITSQITLTTTDETGTAVTSIVADSMPGQATISATVPGTGLTQSITISFTGGTVGYIQVLAEKSVLKANGVDQTIITATAKTADNQAIEGAVISFSTTGGTITTPFTTDANGQAKATLTSGRYNGEAVVTARSQAGDAATTTVLFEGVTLSLTADPRVSFYQEVDPDSVEILAVLRDAENRPIEGEEISFDLYSYDPADPPPPVSDPVIGNFIETTPYITDASGAVTVHLLPNQSGTIYVLADTDVLGTVAPEVVNVVFNKYQMILSVDPASIRVNETAEITASISENGVPKNNVTVFFSATLGSLIGGTTDTTGVGLNLPGEAKTILQAGNQSGKVTLSAIAVINGQELIAASEISVAGGAAKKIVLKTDPGIIATDTGSAAIKAIMYDMNDQPAGNQKIYFRLVEGPGGGEYLTKSVATTDALTGKAEVQLIAGNIPSAKIGDVVIEASTEPDFTGASAVTALTIAGPVANIGVSINLETVQTGDAQGHIEVAVSGIATDIYGNPVADNNQINFSVTSIAFDEDRDNDFTINCRKFNGQPCDGTESVSDLGITWFSDDINQDGTMYSLFGPMAPSEDANQNGILDAGEDKNGNGVLDPPQGVTIDSPTATTNGIATTTVYYPMSYANNIKIRISAEAGGITSFYDSILLCTETMVELGTCGLGY